MTKAILFGIVVAAVMVFGVFATSQNQAVSQEMEGEPSEISEAVAIKEELKVSVSKSELGKHLVDTETISLTGRLASGDFKLLMDITGYLSESGHVAMKVPCGSDGEQLLAIVAGVAPDVSPIDLDYVEPLSNPPFSCVYHGEIPEGITDIALINTSDERINFFGKSSAGYSVTINIHGFSGGHM